MGFLWPIQVHAPNAISSGPAVFARLAVVTNRQTDTDRQHEALAAMSLNNNNNNNNNNNFYCRCYCTVRLKKGTNFLVCIFSMSDRNW